MARMATHYIEVSGPLFDSEMTRLFKGAVAQGIEDIADEADDIMVSHIVAGGMVVSGALMRSVDAVMVRSSQDVIGYATVTPTDTWGGVVTIRQTGTVKKTSAKTGKTRRVKTWAHTSFTSASRPTKTWLTKGTRNGKQLRRGYDFYRRTAQDVRRLAPHDMVLRRVMAVLE